MPPPYPSYVSCYGEDPDDASGCGVYHVHILIQERHRRLTSVGQVRIHDAAGDWRNDQSSQGKSLDTRGEWHKEEVECPISIQCSLSRAETPDSLMICVPISYRSSRSFSTTHHHHHHHHGRYPYLTPSAQLLSDWHAQNVLYPPIITT